MAQLALIMLRRGSADEQANDSRPSDRLGGHGTAGIGGTRPMVGASEFLGDRQRGRRQATCRTLVQFLSRGRSGNHPRHQQRRSTIYSRCSHALDDGNVTQSIPSDATCENARSALVSRRNRQPDCIHTQHAGLVTRGAVSTAETGQIRVGISSIRSRRSRGSSAP
jgi:hypothetical protein